MINGLQVWQMFSVSLPNFYVMIQKCEANHISSTYKQCECSKLLKCSLILCFFICNMEAMSIRDRVILNNIFTYLADFLARNK